MDCMFELWLIIVLGRMGSTILPAANCRPFEIRSMVRVIGRPTSIEKAQCERHGCVRRRRRCVCGALTDGKTMRLKAA